MKCGHCKKVIKGKHEVIGRDLRAKTLHTHCVKAYIDKVLGRIQQKRVERQKLTDKGLNERKTTNAKEAAKKTLWEHFKRYIYLRDSNEFGECLCISCGTKLHYSSPSLHAGHFIRKSKAEFFYFHEDNVHAQCANCNNFGSQEVGMMYEKALRKKIGDKKVDALIKHRNNPPRTSRTLEDYKQLCKEYLNRNKKFTK